MLGLGETPKARAITLNKILKSIYDGGKGAEKNNITDMLTDLRHLCDYKNISFEECDRSARAHYLPEREAQSLNCE